MDEEDVLHHQTLLPADMLENSPSKRDGVSAADEYAQRVWGCELIQEAGILLRLPQVVMCTGQNIFQRFYYRVSLKRFDAFLSAMGCFFLACKIEEKPKRLRECLMVFHFVYRVRTKSSATLELGGVRYNGWKNELVKVERHILKELGFSFYIIDHSHKFILFYVKLLDCDGELAQEAWNYLNDCLRTDAALRYRSEVLACAAIYMAARRLQHKLPDDPAAPWWEVFRVGKADLDAVVAAVLALYVRDPAVWLPSLAPGLRLTDDGYEAELAAALEKRRVEQDVRDAEARAKAEAEAAAAAEAEAAKPEEKARSPRVDDDRHRDRDRDRRDRDRDRSRRDRSRSRDRDRKRRDRSRSRSRDRKKSHRKH
jgi:transcription initiation factor TFIIIB Brf1 subunit/transcription initiation factor TFIIB